MAVNLMYTKGFDAGYKMGLQSGLKGSAARLVMERDLIHIYGRMAIVLFEKHGWSQDDIEDLIAEIQEAWHNAEAEAIVSNQTMAEMVKSRTGIELAQFTEDILDGGWDNDV